MTFVFSYAKSWFSCVTDHILLTCISLRLQIVTPIIIYSLHIDTTPNCDAYHYLLTCISLRLRIVTSIIIYSPAYHYDSEFLLLKIIRPALPAYRYDSEFLLFNIIRPALPAYCYDSEFLLFNIIRPALPAYCYDSEFLLFKIIRPRLFLEVTHVKCRHRKISVIVLQRRII